MAKLPVRLLRTDVFLTSVYVFRNPVIYNRTNELPFRATHPLSNVVDTLLISRLSFPMYPLRPGPQFSHTRPSICSYSNTMDLSPQNQLQIPRIAISTTTRINLTITAAENAVSVLQC